VRFCHDQKKKKVCAAEKSWGKEGKTSPSASESKETSLRKDAKKENANIGERRKRESLLLPPRFQDSRTCSRLCTQRGVRRSRGRRKE